MVVVIGPGAQEWLDRIMPASVKERGDHCDLFCAAETSEVVDDKLKDGIRPYDFTFISCFPGCDQAKRQQYAQESAARFEDVRPLPPEKLDGQLRYNVSTDTPEIRLSFQTVPIGKDEAISILLNGYSAFVGK